MDLALESTEWETGPGSAQRQELSGGLGLMDEPNLLEWPLELLSLRLISSIHPATCHPQSKPRGTPPPCTFWFLSCFCPNTLPWLPAVSRPSHRFRAPANLPMPNALLLPPSQNLHLTPDCPSSPAFSPHSQR